MPADNLAFAEAEGFTFPLLSDVDRAVGRAYGTEREDGTALPRRMTFLIGPDGVVAKVYDVDDIGQHPEQVLGDVRALSGAQP